MDNEEWYNIYQQVCVCYPKSFEPYTVPHWSEEKTKFRLYKVDFCTYCTLFKSWSLQWSLKCIIKNLSIMRHATRCLKVVLPYLFKFGQKAGNSRYNFFLHNVSGNLLNFAKYFNFITKIQIIRWDVGSKNDAAKLKNYRWNIGSVVLWLKINRILIKKHASFAMVTIMTDVIVHEFFLFLFFFYWSLFYLRSYRIFTYIY